MAVLQVCIYKRYCCLGLTTPVDQRQSAGRKRCKTAKDFHGAHRRAGQGQRGAKTLEQSIAAHSANSGDSNRARRRYPSRFFALRLLIAPAAQFDAL